ncbi:MAG: hypothetical protein NTV23_06200 [Propionibacteriales bacterium]|nr:hypothetical protein [Propionibacteriales bacterium]
MTSVSRWRREVERAPRSSLPSSVKLALLAHADTKGGDHFHDHAANIHSYKYEFIAERTRQSVRNVNRLMNRAIEEGYLHRHSGGWRGHQQEFHYTLPWEPTDCVECLAADNLNNSSETDSSNSEWVTTTAPKEAEEMGDIVVIPSSTEGDVVTYLQPRGLQAAAWRPRGSDEGGGELRAEGPVAPDCTACRRPLHGDLWRSEPHHTTHPACETGNTTRAA